MLRRRAGAGLGVGGGVSALTELTQMVHFIVCDIKRCTK